jgi:aminodeoxyfutalosine deaminase
MILKARTVISRADTTIDSGAVVLDDHRICAVDRCERIRQHYGGPLLDLGDVILCPGLINAHCHLDFTRMAGQLSPPSNFPDWIQSLLALRSTWTDQNLVESWLEGARMLVEHGVTTVADHETYPLMLPQLLPQTPLRVFSFIELVDLRGGDHLAAKVEAAVSLARSLTGMDGWRGISPHAPYTTTHSFLKLIATACRQNAWRMSVHAAESESEYAMFRWSRGPMFDWLKNQREVADCGRSSPMRQLAKAGILGEDCLVVHANYLGTRDAALLGRLGASVVHCPNSHAYFSHRPFRYRTLASAGVNICFGTDSLASTLAPRGRPAQLDLLGEIRLFNTRCPGIAPPQLFAMSTMHGAKALGLERVLGELAPGFLADLIVIPYAGPAATAAEAWLHHEGPVAGSMINGRWVIAPKDHSAS